MSEQANKAAEQPDGRRGLVSISVLLEHPEIVKMIVVHTRSVVLDIARAVLADYRKDTSCIKHPPDLSAVIETIRLKLLHSSRDSLRPVVNASGIILHTGLGRAVLPQAAVDALAGMSGCCNLQIDMETGLRGKRNYMSERLLARITGAEAAVVVNNNAAATFLILTALCKGREVIISRGQLIEIGGSFRLPDCIRESGAIMVEVGTTNKTHLRDYASVLTEDTGAILRVNPSNYRITGFAKEVPTVDLVGLKEQQPTMVIDDLGCGALIDMQQYGFPHEPTVQESIAAGADLVCFSGDKLIGGPQCGIIVGKEELINKIKRHPMNRMMRVGKLTDVALEQTLRMFLTPETLIENHPVLRMLAATLPDLEEKAGSIKGRLRDIADIEVTVAKGQSAMGGGSLPAVPIETFVVALESTTRSADQLAVLLRENDPPVIGRIKENRVLLDMRTLLDKEDKAIVEAITRISRA